MSQWDKIINAVGRWAGFSACISLKCDTLCFICFGVYIEDLFIQIVLRLFVQYVCLCVVASVWRLEENLKNSVLSFYIYVGSKDPTQVTRLGSKGLYLLGHLACPLFVWYIPQAGTELVFFLLWHPKCYGYQCASPFPIFLIHFKKPLV